VLVVAIVVHHPDFLGAGTGTDESDLRSGYTRKASGELADDFVCELMREFADLRVGRRAAIDLGDDWLRRRIADIVEPGVDADLGGRLDEIAESHQVGVDWRIVQERLRSSEGWEGEGVG